MFRKISEQIKNSDAYASWGTRLYDTIKWLGWDGYLNAFLMSVGTFVMAALLRLVGAVPWYWWVPVALFTGTYVAKFYGAVRAAWALRGVKSFDVVEFGQRCSRYYDDYMRFVRTEQLRAIPTAREPELDDDADRLAAHHARVAASNAVKIAVAEQFAARALALIHQLTHLGIPRPSTVHFTYNMDSLSVYIGLVGGLLQTGDLDGARKLDPQQTWGAHFY